MLVEALKCYSCKEENEEMCEKKKVPKDCINETSCMTVSYQKQKIKSVLNVTQKDCFDELCVDCSIMSKKYIFNCQVCQSIPMREKRANTESAFSVPHLPVFILKTDIYSVNLRI